MEVVDSEGKLFGVVNVLDLLILLVFVAAVGTGLYYVYGMQSKPVTKQVQLRVNNIQDFRLQTLKQTSVKYNGETVGNITGWETLRSEPSQSDILLQLQLRFTKRENKTLLNGDQVFLGDSIDITTDATQFSGTIVGMGNITYPPKEGKLGLQVRAKGLPPYVADQIQENDPILTADEQVGTVQNVRVSPAEVVLTTEQGKIVERVHPKKKDVTMDVQLHVIRRGSSNYFQGQRLRVGNGIRLEFAHTDITATITDVG